MRFSVVTRSVVCIRVMVDAGHRRRGRRLSACLCALVLATPSAAWAQGTPDELARRHFDSGAAYLEESDYDNALKAFEKAYELSKRPEILLNIATVLERKGDLRGAVSALERYLEAAPSGEHAETVKLRIQNLQKRIDEQAASEPAPAPAPEPAPAQAPAPAPAVAPAPSPSPPPAPEPRPNRLPAVIAFGIGGLAAGGAVVTGVLASSEYDDAEKSCSPRCSDAQVRDGKTLALTSTILTGVAAVGVGVGLTLWLTSSPSAESGAGTPRLRVGMLPAGHAGADATFRF